MEVEFQLTVRDLIADAAGEGFVIAYYQKQMISWWNGTSEASMSPFVIALATSFRLDGLPWVSVIVSPSGVAFGFSGLWLTVLCTEEAEGR